MTDLVEGQFQFSMRSHQKEGSFQFFCIQVTLEACSLSFSVKLFSEIQYKAEERKRQITTSQQTTTFQLPEATMPQEYVNTYSPFRKLRQFQLQLCSHWRTCYSDCQSKATTKAFIFITVKTACYFIRSCG